jgi:hypothetical protein
MVVVSKMIDKSRACTFLDGDSQGEPHVGGARGVYSYLTPIFSNLKLG